jgi:hypothetical protein
LTIRIFVSHSSRDRTLAKKLVDVIERGIKIPSKQIRCTSVPGYQLPVGVPVAQRLSQEIREATVVIGLVTPHSVGSSYVLFELGAAWGLQKPTFPLLAKGANKGNLPEPLKLAHAVTITKATAVRQILRTLTEENGFTDKKPDPELLEAAIQGVTRSARPLRRKAQKRGLAAAADRAGRHP